MSLYVDIEKRYGKFHLKMQFESGHEVLSLLGASGCGKSLTLKCIAGIETPDRGRILLDGKVLFDSEKGINLPPQKRKVGYLFQQYALFPNMTVYQNIAVSVKAGRQREDKNRRARQKQKTIKANLKITEAELKSIEEASTTTMNDMVLEILDNIGLAGMENKYPHQLSGGQQQRVALARILVNEPDILLLDEPFSALDSHLRFRLEQQVRDIIRRFGKSVVLVSHNRDEVFRLTDKIAIVSDGHVETIGDKHEVFRKPQTKNAAILTGCKNVSPVRQIDEHHLLATDWNMTLCLPETKSTAPVFTKEEISHVGIRMKYIRRYDPKEARDEKDWDGNRSERENIFTCRVVEVIENPFSYTVMLVHAHDPGPVPIGWELLKDVWEGMQADTVTICMPDSAMLLLRDQEII